MSRCLNCCHKRRWRALHTFVEAFQGCYKGGVTGGWDFRSMSGICMFFRFIVVIVNYHIVHQIGWLLRAMMVLSLSMLILIVQPYKKSYMNVLDTLLLALLWFLTLLTVTFEFLLPSSRDETLPITFMIAVVFHSLSCWYANETKQKNYQRLIHCLIDWLIPTSITDLFCQRLSMHTCVNSETQYKDKSHLCTHMAQSAREKNALHQLYDRPAYMLCTGENDSIELLL